MIGQLQMSVMCVLVAFIVALLVTVIVYKHSSDAYKREVVILNEGIELQNAKINEFKSQSDKLNKQIEGNEKLASGNLKANLKKDNKILNDSVPSDCDGSMNWLKQQAMEISHDSH
jgi:hypothetical protein